MSVPSAVADRWAVFLDFDGTLADIAERPDAVVVEPDLPGHLRSLKEACGGALAIVTGRAIDVIDGFLPGLHLDVYGLHGIERRLAERTQRMPASDLEAFRLRVPSLIVPLQSIPGVIIEDKGESVAFHWRQAPDAEAILREAAGTLAEGLAGFRLQEGKALVEVVPASSGKGAAIAALMEEAPYRGRRPIFVGDDVTDESGFAAVNERRGLSIKIGAGDTAAGARLPTPAAFRSCLSQGLDAIVAAAVLGAERPLRHEAVTL